MLGNPLTGLGGNASPAGAITPMCDSYTGTDGPFLQSLWTMQRRYLLVGGFGMPLWVKLMESSEPKVAG